MYQQTIIKTTTMGLLLSRLSDIFASFGMQKPARILMLGLDAAGKTTILYKVKLDEQVQTIATIGTYLGEKLPRPNMNSILGFNVETVSPCPGITFTVWDVSLER